MLKLRIFGWDNGFGSDKFFGERASSKDLSSIFKDEYIQLAIPSIATELPTSILANSTPIFDTIRGNLTPEKEAEKIIIEYNDRKYAVGKHALIQNLKGANRSFKVDKFRNLSETLKLFAGIACMYPEETEIEISELAVGLSLEAFNEYQEELERKYSNFKAEFTVETKNSKKPRKITLYIKNCYCMAQGMGAYWDQMFVFFNGQALPSAESKNLMNRRYGIVDIGDKTCDCFIRHGLELVDGSEIIFDYGISKVYKMVSDQLAGCPEKEIEDIYLGVLYPKSGNHHTEIFWKDRNYTADDIYKLVNGKFVIVADEITQKISEKWNSEFDSLSLIILSGGGAELTKERMEKIIKNRIVVVTDPQFANVRGYYKSRLFNLCKPFSAATSR